LAKALTPVARMKNYLIPNKNKNKGPAENLTC